MGAWCAGMGAGGWLAMIAFWVVVIALVVWAVGRVFPEQRGQDPRSTLDVRLAAGQIDQETYRALRDELERPPAVRLRDTS